MTTLPPPDDLARHCDRISRLTNAHRTGVTLAEVPRGWARLRPGGDQGEVPSSTFNRVHWLAVDSPLTRHDTEAMRATLLAHDACRAFLWVSAAGASAGGDAELRRAGGDLWPFVRYIALARPALPATPPRPSALTVRPVPAPEIRDIFAASAAWYGSDGAATASTLVDRGLAEVFAAFDGPTPVALAALIMDRDDPAGLWGYLGWAGTAPTHRGQGAQSALIAARISRAAALGARWCTSETNTAVEGSLRNLVRGGFTPAAEWSVYRWQA